MSTRTVLLDESISSGNTVTSNKVTVSNDGTVTFQIEGDSDADNIDIEVQARIDPLDEWSTLRYKENQDLTLLPTDNDLLQYDILDLEEFRVKITNNSQNPTSIKIISSHSEQR